jgi:hypothetical protein
MVVKVCNVKVHISSLIISKPATYIVSFINIFPTHVYVYNDILFLKEYDLPARALFANKNVCFCSVGEGLSRDLRNATVSWDGLPMAISLMA